MPSTHRSKRYASLFIMSGLVAAAQWPTPKTSMEAYEFVQARRQEAAKLWAAKDPKGIELLTGAMAYLEQPLVRDLAAGNKFLQARRLNILLDLAEAHALRLNKEEMLSVLRQASQISPSPELAKFIESREAFIPFLSTPEFQNVLAGFHFYDRLWDSVELGGPSRGELTEAERVAGLSKFWSEVKYNFGYPEKLIRLHWDRLYLEWIPKVQAAKSSGDYYKQFMRLCALLEDGHTNVYAPPELDTSSKTPLRTVKIGDRVFIEEVFAPSLEAQGIRAASKFCAWMVNPC